MKLRSLAAVLLPVSALMAFACTASATTLEIKGVKQTAAVSIHATLEKETSFLETTTFGEGINTCTESTIQGTTTTPFTGTRVGLPVASLSFGGCTQGLPTIHTKGYLEIEWISGTTNGTVFWKNLKLTTPSVFGSLTCTTPSTGTDIGTLTGVASGRATLHFHAVLNCGILTATWAGKYEVTSPDGLGVTS
jgi:hypothetical protein